MTPVTVRVRRSAVCAMPKSSTLVTPSSRTMMFCGLTSRCTSPSGCPASSTARCACARPRPASRAMATASGAGSGVLSCHARFIIPDSARPRTNSMTMTGCPCQTPTSSNETTLGWFSRATTRASSRNWLTKAGSAARSGSSVLRMTGRRTPPAPCCTARKTSPMPPTASRRCTSYRPSTSSMAAHGTVPSRHGQRVARQRHTGAWRPVLGQRASSRPTRRLVRATVESHGELSNKFSDFSTEIPVTCR